MQTQVTLLSLKTSPALARRIRDKAHALERYHSRIRYCRVNVAQDDKRRTHGRPFVVTVRLGVPGRELVASHRHHVDPYLAVRDAFAAVRRQLQRSHDEEHDIAAARAGA